MMHLCNEAGKEGRKLSGVTVLCSAVFLEAYVSAEGIIVGRERCRKNKSASRALGVITFSKDGPSQP